jgi:hypothetical protein
MNNLKNYIEDNELSYIITDNNKGHSVKMGCESGKHNKNPYYNMLDFETGDEFIYLECKGPVYTKISIESIDIIKELGTTFFLCKNGYIATNNNQLQFYLHQYLMDHYGKGKGQISVDHINRDKLDNRMINLRLLSQSDQNRNCDKRRRKYNAQQLPPDLENVTFPKYSYYCSEYINKGKPNEYVREFFRIEKHPNLNGKKWSSTKSMKKTIIEKFIQTKEKARELDSM